ncbi:MAG: hypothetical protein J6W82_09260 [Bacteroidales bacterium]|nr:hypothetical protein [Bacteroidales bacterium]
MKTAFLFVPAVALATTCCSLLDPPLPLSDPRNSAHASDSSRAIRRDTVFMVSAVSFPDNYDWQRDTAFGAVSCTLELYEGGKRVLSLPAGPSKRISAAPDRHHIIGGKLYSDYCDRSGTTVKCNGTTIGEWDDPEIIIGILPLEGTVYTLGRSNTGSGFSFRRNGNIILQSAGGVPLGGFGMDTYGPTGALYQDKGSICFTYRYGDAAYLVSDGVQTQLASEPGALFLDAKRLGGIPSVLFKYDGFTILLYDGYYVNIDFGGTFNWIEGGIFMHGGDPAVAGRVDSGGPGAGNLGVGLDGDYTSFGPDAEYVFIDGDSWHPLKKPSGCYLFNRNCASFIDGEFALALTPTDGSDPYLEVAGDTITYKLHGFLSGMAIDIRESYAD